MEADSYTITLFRKKLFKIQILHVFKSDSIRIVDFEFVKSQNISNFEHLEKIYLETKELVKQITDEINTTLIPQLPKF